MNPIAELNRRLDNLIRFGTIAKVDYEASRVRVKSGELLTDWLPFFNLRAASSFVWDPPEQGEQAIIFSPSGELLAGVVIYGLGSSKYPAPSADPKLHRRTYPDSAVIEYHHGDHHLKATLPEEEGQITISLGNSNIHVNTNEVRFFSNGSFIELNALGVKIFGPKVELN